MQAIAGYTDLRPHGPARWGATYLATPPPRLATRSPVVLNVLDVAHEPEGLRQVAEELRLFASAASPCLLRLLDAGHEEHRFFYAVEHLPLGTLAEPAGEVEPTGILRVVAEAAQGAHALHEVGIAHGAISPSMISLHDDGGKLGTPALDRFLHPGRTVVGASPVISVECTDPSVIRGGRPGRPSDIWSLGVTLHRTMSGRSIYGDELSAGNLEGAVRRLLATRPQVADGLEPDLAVIVQACLAVDPDDRPPTALAVAGLLEEML